MNSKDRRDNILLRLLENNTPIKGAEFAKLYDVTRQIIVKDIAILRARGYNIIATPEGYIISNIEDNKIKFIVAVEHHAENLKSELEIIIKYGGTIEDVIVEHPIYGEIKANLMIRNLNDMNKFIDKYTNNNAKPLSILTNGVHLHTISVDNEESRELIKKDLKKNNFIVC